MAVVVLVMDPFRQNYGIARHVLIRHLIEEVMDAIQPGFLLIHRLHDPPGSLGDVGAIEHDFLGLRVILPTPARFEIHGA